ncbi:nodulation protein NodF [Mesorhizobium sp. L2C054A000]|nr:nodulation protein NodF [Mesorhizobium sp. L2C054A000]
MNDAENASWKGNKMSDQLANEIIAMIKKRAASEGGIAPATGGEITAATRLTSLGIDSLGLADVLWDLEQAYGIEIEMNTAEAWSDLQNVGDMVEAVRSLLATGV